MAKSNKERLRDFYALNPKAHSESQRRYRRSHPGRRSKDRESWKLRNPQKHAAHMAVRAAVRSGELERPNYCSECLIGGPPIEAHHGLGYAPKFRLIVIWLCRPCHVKKHRSEPAS